MTARPCAAREGRQRRVGRRYGSSERPPRANAVALLLEPDQTEATLCRWPPDRSEDPAKLTVGSDSAEVGNTAPNPPEVWGVCSPFHRPRVSKDRTHHEHPPARDEMRQVVRQALDLFACLFLEAFHRDDLGDQHVIG